MNGVGPKSWTAKIEGPAVAGGKVKVSVDASDLHCTNVQDCTAAWSVSYRFGDRTQTGTPTDKGYYITPSNVLTFWVEIPSDCANVESLYLTCVHTGGTHSGG